MTADPDARLFAGKDGTLDMTVVAPSVASMWATSQLHADRDEHGQRRPLHGVSIVDAKLGTLTCAQPVTLAPGATLVCTGSYTVTQGEIDAGQVDNTATADSDRDAAGRHAEDGAADQGARAVADEGRRRST